MLSVPVKRLSTALLPRSIVLSDLLVLPLSRQRCLKTTFTAFTGEFESQTQSSGAPAVLGGFALRPCPGRSSERRAGSSGFLGSWRENHGGGETVHAQRWDVDLIAAISGELEGEFSWRARSDGTERAPEMNSGGKRTGSQQDRSQSVGGDDGRGERVGC